MERISQPAPDQAERPIPPEIYPVIDNDLARDNAEHDLLHNDSETKHYFETLPDYAREQISTRSDSVRLPA